MKQKQRDDGCSGRTNEVNAIRQNIRAILDSSARRRGYSPEEIEAMERVVRGSAVQNALRHVAGLSPAKGVMQSAFALGTTGTMGPEWLIPAGTGLAADMATRGMARRDVSVLDALIRNGGVRPRHAANPDRSRLVAALMAAQASRAIPQ